MTDNPPMDAELIAIARRAERLRDAVRFGGGVAVVAKRIGMPIPTLNNYLAGRDMKASAMVALAEGCGVSVEWLALGRGEMDGSNICRNEGFMPGFEALLTEKLNFWAAFILLRSCQEYHQAARIKPTIAEVLEWIGPPYLKARELPDTKIEFKSPAETDQ